MTHDEILTKMQEVYGENVADPTIFQKMFMFQFCLTKWELENGKTD